MAMLAFAYGRPLLAARPPLTPPAAERARDARPSPGIVVASNPRMALIAARSRSAVPEGAVRDARPRPR